MTRDTGHRRARVATAAHPQRALVRPATRAATQAPAGRGGWSWLFPPLTLAVFLGPIAAGLIGTWLPAFGVLPALGGTHFTLSPWRDLIAAPGFGTAVALTLFTGLGATILSFVLAVGFAAAWHDSRSFGLLRRVLAPMLALPHAAFAIGLAFLMAPSGFAARLLSPWATGWDRPPDLATVQDPWGLALTAALVAKETPFLLLMIIAALGQTSAPRALSVARAMGYGPVTAWIKTVLPAIYPQIRLPVYAVLAYALSVVDMAMILGPTLPPTLAPMILRWANDPDLGLRFQAAAGACLQLILTVAAIAAWHGGERLIAFIGRGWLTGGGRGGRGRMARIATGGGMGLAVTTTAAALLCLALWSVTGRWRYPDALPTAWSLDTWARTADGLAGPAATTAATALVSTLLALILSLGCLEYERRAGLKPSARGLWLIYIPLMVPQIGFLFGLQVLLVRLGLDGTPTALVWSHLLFVLPYVFLALADPYRSLDDRYARSAACLGASPWAVFLRVRLPLLLRPILIAGAIGFSVSVAQYLPTVFAGAGRLPTLTTEAVALASAADRRVVAVLAFAQAAMPLALFALALAVPAWLHRRRRGMRV